MDDLFEHRVVMNFVFKEENFQCRLRFLDAALYVAQRFKVGITEV